MAVHGRSRLRRHGTPNVRYFIASSAWQSEAEFDASGARDAALFFSGLEELLRPDAVVLDLGCGVGRMDRHLAPRVGRLIGLDISGEMLRLARARLAGLANVDLIEGDGHSLQPLADDALDLVFSYVTFQHIPDGPLSAYLREAHRVLRAGGRFVFQFVEAAGDLVGRVVDSSF